MRYTVDFSELTATYSYRIRHAICIQSNFFRPLDGTVVFEVIILNRYLINARSRLFLQSLQKKLTEVQIQLEWEAPNVFKIAWKVNYSELFTDEVSVRDFLLDLDAHWDERYNLITSCLFLLNTCARLPHRGGKKEYRLLTPSRLAKLCMIEFNDLPNIYHA